MSDWSFYISRIVRCWLNECTNNPKTNTNVSCSLTLGVQEGLSEESSWPNVKLFVMLTQNHTTHCWRGNVIKNQLTLRAFNAWLQESIDVNCQGTQSSLSLPQMLFSQLFAGLGTSQTLNPWQSLEFGKGIDQLWNTLEAWSSFT